VEDGQSWQAGRLKLTAIHTPGHTPGSMSYLLADADGAPWMVFTGDTLFAGDVGRVDLMGMGLAEENAEALFDSLFDKLLPLGDHVILCPAHGSGSVCGSAIAERAWTTLGLERRTNPKLQLTGRDEFVRHVAKRLERPPYFRKMENWNVRGAPLLGALPTPRPLSPALFAEQVAQGFVLDTRSEVAFAGAHVPDALSIWMEGLAGFAGWFVPYDRPLGLVNEEDDPREAVRTLLRLGYDDIQASLSGGMLAWHTAGRESAAVATLTVQDFCRHLDGSGEAWILDVRSEAELEEEGRIADGHHIHLTQLPEQRAAVPDDQPVYVFCGSGLRSMVAASLLRRWGHEQVSVILGGLAGWTSATCPIEL
jgi:hydroxyacylglutathione hydrolase